jgi:hypothetical protein
MKSYHFFLKDLFDTGMYSGACCMYSLRLAIQMGVEGGFCGICTRRYQYVQGKKVFGQGGA